MIILRRRKWKITPLSLEIGPVGLAHIKMIRGMQQEIQRASGIPSKFFDAGKIVTSGDGMLHVSAKG